MSTLEDLKLILFYTYVYGLLRNKDIKV